MLNTQRVQSKEEKIEKAFAVYEKYLSQINWHYMKLKNYTLWKKNFLMATRIRELSTRLDKIDSQRRRTIFNKYSYRIREGS